MAKNARKTHCKRNHALVGANLVRKAGGRARACRECIRIIGRTKNAYQRAYRKRLGPEERARRNAYLRAWKRRRREALK